MIRKKLLLAVVVALGLMSLPTATASANDLYLTGETEVGEPEYASAEGVASVERNEGGASTLLETSTVAVTCGDIDLYASSSKPKEYLSLWNAKFADCSLHVVFEGHDEETEVTVTPNSCKFSYSGFEYIAGPDFEAAAEIDCPEGKELEISLPSNLCDVYIPEQALSQPGKLTNTDAKGDEHLKAQVSGSGLAYNVNEKQYCPFLGLKEGYNEDGATEIDLLIREASMAGGSSKVMAEEYPNAVTGERYEESGVKAPLDVFELGNGDKLSCGDVEVDGGTLSESVYELSLTPTFSECEWVSEEWGPFPWELDMNSCGYFIPEFKFNSAEGSYRYIPEIRCVEEGDAIVVGDMYCSFTIPPQSLNTEFLALNKEIGGQKDIATGFLGDNLEYTAKGNYCPALGPSEGEHDDGSLALGFLLK